MANIIIIYDKIVKHNIDSDKIIILCTQAQNSINILNTLINNINKPFLIISGMEDLEFPNDLHTFNILNDNNLIHWFSVNNILTINNNKLSKLPYGLNYWTLSYGSYRLDNKITIEEQNNILLKIYNNAQPLKNRKLKIYCNAHLTCTDNRYGKYRSKLKDIIDPTIIDYQSDIIERENMWKIFSEYCFILSPYGNGLDTIRTYEALCLGCIPIIKKSNIDDVYNNLPILIINDWSELNYNILNSYLKDFEQKQFNYDKLYMKYWIDLISNKLDNY